VKTKQVTGDGPQEISLSGIGTSALGHQDPAAGSRTADT